MENLNWHHKLCRLDNKVSNVALPVFPKVHVAYQIQGALNKTRTLISHHIMISKIW